MSDRFLVRPAPFSGESLSSWRQRCAWANGYRLFPLHDQRTRRVDPDIGLREEDLRWLATSHDVPEPIVHSLSLRGLVGRTVADVQCRRHAAWWLPARYGKQQASIAAMFCPLCLQLDAVPHYRLGWRLAFNYACAAHGVLLHESCGNCAAPPWPAGCGVADRISSRFTSFDVCWKCGQAPAATSHKQAIQQDLPNSWLTEGYAQIGEAMVPSSEAFAALRALCQLFVRKDTRALIASGRGPCAEAARLLGGEDDLRSIELASVRIRAAVIPASLGLLVKWPQVFIDFTAEVGISRMHFNASYQSHPAWFNDCLRNHLARQNRWVTPEMIRSTARQILVAGGIPTKAAIRQKLAWQGDISDELMPPAA